MAKNVLRKPGRALDFTANIATAASSRNSKATLSTFPELKIFYSTVTVYISGKLPDFMPSKLNKTQTDYTQVHH